jgi:sorbitol/mannitol transport system substrate-binding protein
MALQAIFIRGTQKNCEVKKKTMPDLRCLPPLIALLAGCTLVQSEARITIATVNNGDMIIMKKLSQIFEKQNPDIKLDWVILEENVLRGRVTTDIATQGAQFDIMTIGTYEAAIWGKRSWLMRLDDDLPASYDLNDVLKPIRDGLSYETRLYALPFYGESLFTFYRKDLFDKAGLKMPEQPTYNDIARFASLLHDPQKGIYGICLRGKPGWGENTAYVSTLVNTFGGRWFDEKWDPQLNTPEWRQAISFYIDLLRKYGPPGASSNGHNECRALFASGKCAMWIDATVAASTMFNPAESRVAEKVAFARAPIQKTPRGAQWIWSWALAIPVSSKHVKEAKRFIQWATSKDYVKLVAKTYGWAAVPPGTRKSTYGQPEYIRAAPFAELTLKSILAADPTRPTAKPVPYTGIQYVAIPEFQSIGAQVGQLLAAALVGNTTVDQALQAAQLAVERTMRRAGYLK